jgi:hypothetical protein
MFWLCDVLYIWSDFYLYLREAEILRKNTRTYIGQEDCGELDRMEDLQIIRWCGCFEEKTPWESLELDGRTLFGGMS